MVRRALAPLLLGPTAVATLARAPLVARVVHTGVPAVRACGLVHVRGPVVSVSRVLFEPLDCPI